MSALSRCCVYVRGVAAAAACGLAARGRGATVGVVVVCCALRVSPRLDRKRWAGRVESSASRTVTADVLRGSTTPTAFCRSAASLRVTWLSSARARLHPPSPASPTRCFQNPPQHAYTPQTHTHTHQTHYHHHPDTKPTQHKGLPVADWPHLHRHAAERRLWLQPRALHAQHILQQRRRRRRVMRLKVARRGCAHAGARRAAAIDAPPLSVARSCDVWAKGSLVVIAICC